MFFSTAPGMRLAREMNRTDRRAARRERREERATRRAAEARRREVRRAWRTWQREQWLAAWAPVTRRGLRATQFATVLSVVLFGAEMVLLARVDDNLVAAIALAVTLASTWGLIMLFSALADRGRRNLSAWRNYPPRMTPLTTDV